MGKVLVIYDSVSGNTKQMADYVAEGAGTVPGIECVLSTVEKATMEDALWADGIAAGSPTYTGMVSWRMKKYWDDIVPKSMGADGWQVGLRILPHRVVGVVVRN